MFDAINQLQGLVLLLLWIALLAVEVWALVDAARRPAAAFLAAEKRTKNFWLVLLGVGAVVGFVASGNLFFMFAAVVPAAIYLGDVRREVALYSRRRPPSGGGW